MILPSPLNGSNRKMNKLSYVGSYKITSPMALSEFSGCLVELMKDLETIILTSKVLEESYILTGINNLGTGIITSHMETSRSLDRMVKL